MHMGFHALYNLYKWYYSAPSSKSKTSSHSLLTLTDEEKALYDKIVVDLLHAASQIRNATPQDTPPLHAIIFRQTESWEKVEELLNEILDPDYTTLVWIANWRQRIVELRGLQKQIRDLEKSIQRPGINNHKLTHFKNTHLAAKNKIVDSIKDAKKALDTDKNDHDLLKNPNVLQVLNFLSNRWLHLTVFSEWSEVPMDCSTVHKLFVQVRQPKSPKLDESKLLNLSTLAIFTFEEFASHVVDNPGNKTRVRTAELTFKRQSIYKTTFPLQQCALIKIADRLHFIVNKAVEEVNSALAEIED